MEDEGWYVHIPENLFQPLEKRYLKILDVWSSNPYLEEYPFLRGLMKLSLFLLECYPTGLVYLYKFDSMQFYPQGLLSYKFH
jgi:hypothetical protein